MPFVPKYMQFHEPHRVYAHIHTHTVTCGVIACRFLVCPADEYLIQPVRCNPVKTCRLSVYNARTSV